MALFALTERALAAQRSVKAGTTWDERNIRSPVLGLPSALRRRKALLLLATAARPTCLVLEVRSQS
jgi:hypothetical protein